MAAYFDSIPHFELLQSVARRVVDRQVLHLIQMWLNAAVEETDKRGNKKRTTRNRDERRGIPQGSPISPPSPDRVDPGEDRQAAHSAPRRTNRDRAKRGLRGWANYFALGPVEDAYRAIESYVTRRLRRWLCIKHEVRGSGCYRFTDQYLHDVLGLVRIRDLLHNLPWATA